MGNCFTSVSEESEDREKIFTSQTGARLGTPATKIIVLTVPHAACMHAYGVENMTTADLVKTIDAINVGLMLNPNETRICDRRALVAAIELKMAIEQRGGKALLLANEVEIRAIVDENRYVGDGDFQKHVLEEVKGASRTGMLVLNIDVHSFNSKGQPGDVITSAERPSKNMYFLTRTGREMGALRNTSLGFEERQGSDINFFLNWFPDTLGVHSVLAEFYENIFEYTPPSLKRDIAVIAEWAVKQ